MNKTNLYSLYHVIDPITGRRVLEKDHIFIGNENNIEEPVDIKQLALNVRDLKAKLNLLAYKFEYIANSSLLIPERNKYLLKAQALNELSNNLLRHVNGIVKEALRGIHYVDTDNFPIEEGKICLIRADATLENNKFIQPTDIDIKEITNIKDITTEIKQTIKDVIEQITNLKEVTDFFTEQIQETIKNLINNSIEIKTELETTVENINNIDNSITNIDRRVTNIENNINNNIENIQQMIDDSTREVTNNFNIELGDLELQLKAQLDAIALLNNQINALFTLLANIEALITALQADLLNIQQGEGECIAWALNNDQLTIVY